jgi:hypothetical protein
MDVKSADRHIIGTVTKSHTGCLAEARIEIYRPIIEN